MKEHLITVRGVIDRRIESASHPNHVIFNWRRSDHVEPGIVECSFFLPMANADLNVGDAVHITVSRAGPSKAGHDDLVDALRELVEIVDGCVRDGVAPNGHIDSFTTQPARAALARATS